jgi:hypothetical protein
VPPPPIGVLKAARVAVEQQDEEAEDEVRHEERGREDLEAPHGSVLERPRRQRRRSVTVSRDHAGRDHEEDEQERQDPAQAGVVLVPLGHRQLVEHAPQTRHRPREARMFVSTSRSSGRVRT